MQITLRIVGYRFSSRLTDTLNLCPNYLKLIQTNIKGGCQLRKKVVPHDSKSDLPLKYTHIPMIPIEKPSRILFLPVWL